MKEKNTKHHHHDKKHHHHHHEHSHKPRETEPVELQKNPNVRDFSIFNQVTVNAPVQQDQEREDGIASCFKSLLQCGKK